MNKVVSLIFLFFFSLSIAAQRQELEGASANSLSSDFRKTYTLECCPGSDFSFKMSAVINAASSNSISYFFVSLDGEIVERKYHYIGTESFEANVRIKSPGHNHVVTVGFYRAYGASVKSVTLSDVVINKSLDAENGMYFQLIENNAVKLVSPILQEGNVVDIPNTISIHFVGIFEVQSLEDSLFMNNTNIEYITLPTSLKNIGEKTFYGCSNMKKVHCYAMQSPAVFNNSFPEYTEVHVFPGSIWYNANAWKNCNIIYDLKNDPYNIDDSWESYSFIPPVKTDQATYKRNFTNTDWQAIYLPFQISYENWCRDFDIAKISNFHQYDTDDDGIFDNVELEIIKVKSGILKANHPYLIRAKDVGQKTITIQQPFFNVTEENSFVCNSMETTYIFTGTYSGISGADMYNNGYYSMGGGALIQAEDATAGLGCFRWYLKMTDREGQVIPAPSQIRVMEWNGQTTGVESLSLDNAPARALTLDGRSVKDMKARGLYIVNGKKVLR